MIFYATSTGSLSSSKKTHVMGWAKLHPSLTSPVNCSENEPAKKMLQGHDCECHLALLRWVEQMKVLDAPGSFPESGGAPYITTS